MRMSIWECWNHLVEFLFEPTAKELDDAARQTIRNELQYLYERTKRLEKLLAEPERLRNRKIAEQLAEEMHRKLVEKRRNPEPLTTQEQFEKNQWEEDKTPREKCKHLKGGLASRWGVDIYGDKFGAHKDYNVAGFRFADGKTKIWCLNNCGFVSWQGDENWVKAKSMLEQSTNTLASSEFVPRKSL